MQQIDLMKHCAMKMTDDRLSLVPATDDGLKMLAKNFPEKRNVMVYWDSRSHPHLKLYFAAIRNAYDNWPELFDFQPDDEEDLRAWLQCKAGSEYRITKVIDGMGNPNQMAKVAQDIISILQGHAYPAIYNGKVAVVAPKSISFKKMGQAKFTDLSNAVSAVLIEVTGLSIDDFKDGVAN